MELMLGHNAPYVVHRGLYPDHERQLTLEWLRGGAMAGADQREAQGAAAPHARVLSWDPWV